MIQHIDWLTDLMSTVRKYSKVTVEDYIDWITTPGVPMDFVAITVLCRIYHIHVGIFFNNGAWSTCRDKHLKSSRFGIVFHGNLEFTETVCTGWTDKYHEWIVSRGQQGKMPSHTRTAMPGLLKMELLHAEVPMEEEDDTVQDMQLDIKVKLPPKGECFVLDLVQKKIKLAKQTLLAKQNYQQHYLLLPSLPCLHRVQLSQVWCSQRNSAVLVVIGSKVHKFVHVATVSKKVRQR